MNLGIAVELILACLLVITIGYCMALNSKVNKLSLLENERNDLINSLNFKIEEGIALRNRLESLLLEGSKLERSGSVRRTSSPSLVPELSQMGLLDRAKQLHEKRIAA